MATYVSEILNAMDEGWSAPDDTDVYKQVMKRKDSGTVLIPSNEPLYTKKVMGGCVWKNTGRVQNAHTFAENRGLQLDRSRMSTELYWPGAAARYV